MNINSNPTTLRARELRQTANPGEQCLWAALKQRQLAGYKFTRQFPIGPYFADFACREKLLLIELDGGQHSESFYDRRRDGYLFDEGYTVLRVPSASVLMNREAVCETILAALEGRLEDTIDAPDLKFVRSKVMPRKVLRRRRWLAPTPTPPSREG
jgi:very-short-patch-repair endonuclease